MYTVTVWESDFDKGAFVAGVEEFTSLPEARSYFGSYFGDIGLRVVLEEKTGNGRSKTLANYDEHGVLYVLKDVHGMTQHVECGPAGPAEFILETHEMNKVTVEG